MLTGKLSAFRHRYCKFPSPVSLVQFFTITHSRGPTRSRIAIRTHHILASLLAEQGRGRRCTMQATATGLCKPRRGEGLAVWRDTLIRRETLRMDGRDTRNTELFLFWNASSQLHSVPRCLYKSPPFLHSSSRASCFVVVCIPPRRGCSTT